MYRGENVEICHSFALLFFLDEVINSKVMFFFNEHLKHPVLLLVDFILAFPDISERLFFDRTFRSQLF